MNEVVRIWLTELFEREINEACETIKNEHLWELGYNGDEPLNPHTENIQILNEYISVLEEMLDEIEEY